MIFCRPCKVVLPKTLAKLVPITQLGFVVGIPYYRTQLRLQYDASETYQPINCGSFLYIYWKMQAERRQILRELLLKLDGESHQHD